MKNFLILLIFLAIILFAGKFYVEYSYEKALDESIAMVAPYAEVRYDNVELALDGSLSLHNLNVTVRESGEVVTAAKIKMESSDRFLALRGKSAFSGGQFPDKSFSLSVERLEADADLYEVAPKKDHCRNFNASFVYSKIGLERVRANARFSFDFRDPYNANLGLYYSDDISTADLQMIFDASDVVAASMTRQAPIKEVSVIMDLEPDVMADVAQYCGGVFNIAPDEFLSKVVGSPKYSINSFGVDLGADFRAALVEFMRGGAQIDLKSTPSKQILELENASLFKAKDVLRWLNLEMSIDEKLVPLQVVEEVKPKKVVKKKKEGVYTKVSVSQANKFIDSTIRIERTNDRSAVTGRLLSGRGDALDVEIYRYNGVMTFTVPKSDIASLEVYSIVEK